MWSAIPLLPMMERSSAKVRFKHDGLLIKRHLYIKTVITFYEYSYNLYDSMLSKDVQS